MYTINIDNQYFLFVLHSVHDWFYYSLISEYPLCLVQRLMCLTVDWSCYVKKDIITMSISFVMRRWVILFVKKKRLTP